MTDRTIGVDISKSHLDAFRLEDGAAQRFENSAAGFRALRKWLGTAPVVRIVFEATGAYHKAFEAALGKTFPLVKVNPLQARRFAEAHGRRAKTDAVDAQMLARMGAAFDLAPQAPCSKEARILRDLNVARAGLIKDRTRLLNRAQTHDIAVLKRQTKARLAHVERQIAELDAEIAGLIEAQETTARSRDILCSIPGIGAVTAAAMLILLPEIGTLARKQVASLAGLAPITRQSGHGRASHSSAAGASHCAMLSTCPHWSPCATTRISRQIRRPARRRKTRQGRHRRIRRENNAPRCFLALLIAQAHRNGKCARQS